jgi:EmrB/QacA subfamily drug resistance transporter
VLAVAILASFVAFLDASVVNLALPSMAADLGGGVPLQQWVVDGYLLTLGALILVAGAISDAYGRVRVLRLGVLVFAVSSLLCAVAPSGSLLIAARCIQGVGAAFLVPSSLALINSTFTGAARARAIGTWTAWTGTAFVVGPPLGGVLVDLLNWRWVFGINVVPLVATLVLLARLPDPDVERTGGRRIDVVGAVLGALGLAGTVFALIEEQRLGLANVAVLVPLVVGLGCLLLFPWWERRAAHPMMPLSLFATRNFAVGNLATVFLYAGVSLGTLVVALFLQEGVGMSASLAGLATLPVPILSFFLATRFGALAGRHGPRWFMAAGPIVAAAGFLLMCTVSASFDFWTQLLPGLVVFGIGLSMTVSPLTAAVLSAVDAAQSGIGSAVNNAISRIAGLIAVAFMGVLVGGTMDATGFRAVAVAVAVSFVLAGLISAVGIRNTDVHDVPADAMASCLDRVR